MVREYIVRMDDDALDGPPETGPQELVRCKECRHAEVSYNEHGDVTIKCYGWVKGPDWFCADGEK